MLRPRPLVSLLFAFFLLSYHISSQAGIPSQSQTQQDATQRVEPRHAPVNCTNNGTYVNSKGETVKRPENCSSAPTGATARCRDGTYSFSQTRRGTCSHHGGVAQWL
jgi:Protein of unknown function (DUF3761)